MSENAIAKSYLMMCGVPEDIAEECVSGVTVEIEKDFRVATALWLYKNEKISQSRGAELAQVSRAEFLDLLSSHGISPFQYSAEEVLEEFD